MSDNLICDLRELQEEEEQVVGDIPERAAKQFEIAAELIRIARMCMNPKTNAEWFEKATAFLNDLQAHR